MKIIKLSTIFFRSVSLLINPSCDERVFRDIRREVTFVQGNHSRSSKGVLSGFPYQLPTHAQGKTSWHEIAQTLIAYAEQQHVPLRTHAADIQAITTAEYPTAAKRPLNSQLDTHKLCSQLSFDLPHWKDDFLAVASGIVKELETV